MAVDTITPEQKAAAAKASATKAEKAEKERARKAVLKALDRAEFEGDAPAYKDLDEAQRRRAAMAKDGLGGSALATFILTGKSTREQTEEAKRRREAKESAEGGKTRRTRASKDPEAAALATAALALARGAKAPLKSGFRAAQARQFLEMKGSVDPIEFLGAPEAVVRRFVDEGAVDDATTELRAKIRELTAGTRLWGRKFAAFAVAAKDGAG